VGHVVSRSVRDSAAFLDATGGPAPGDPYAAPHHPRPWLDEVALPPGRLRIAVSTRPAFDIPVHADAIAAVGAAARLCESIGHHGEEAAPTLNGPEIMHAQGVVISANIAATIDEIAEALGRKAEPSDVERATWYRIETARRTDAPAYARAITTLHMTGRKLAAFMQDYDVILQPVATEPPLKLGVLNMDREDTQALLRELFAFIPYTGIYNITGQPSASVPLYWNAEGLPIGTMFTTRFGDEATLLRLSAQLEQARPWFNRHPPELR
jgi:amidase/6-aminohexanoate-cyclic-dimer hydrolase